MSSLTIALVTWNSEDEIAECLNTLFYSTAKIPNLKLETVIVDNDSSDNTVKVVENFLRMTDQKIVFIKNDSNLGFTKACNQAIHASTGDYVFILNPDTEIFDDAIEKLVNYLDAHDDVGVVSPQLITFSGNIQFSCRTFPTYRDLFFEMSLLSTLFPKSEYFSRWKMRYFDHNSTREVDQPMGAALLLKRKVLEAVGGLDERFIMFYNDVDFCKRIHDSGFKLVFLHTARVRHIQGISIYKDRTGMIKIWNQDCLNYFKKHSYNIFLYSLLFIGLKITGVARILRAKLLKI
ncbi:MAG: glycosyltransferase family 2 protein [Ignavibacteria bacterium]|nr:glycosyltransferase family 2 protein [Ignavibacteria bacterium]